DYLLCNLKINKKYDFFLYSFRGALQIYLAGNCSSPSSFSSLTNYSYDGSNNLSCAWGSGLIEKYPSYDSHGYQLSYNMYSSGSCASPTSLIASTSYTYSYSGSNQVCNSANTGSSVNVNSYGISGSIANSYLQYSAGNCSSPSALVSTSNLSTTTINSNNNSIIASFNSTKSAYSDFAP
ncbi:MAG: hypothetical protein L6Q54_15680, partial [Leptospiraceae bacterium]|nr:hypothetical protein [Leptospiraceae bacterium]